MYNLQVLHWYHEENYLEPYENTNESLTYAFTTIDYFWILASARYDYMRISQSSRKDFVSAVYKYVIELFDIRKVKAFRRFGGTPVILPRCLSPSSDISIISIHML